MQIGVNLSEQSVASIFRQKELHVFPSQKTKASFVISVCVVYRLVNDSLCRSDDEASSDKANCDNEFELNLRKTAKNLIACVLVRISTRGVTSTKQKPNRAGSSDVGDKIEGFLSHTVVLLYCCNVVLL